MAKSKKPSRNQPPKEPTPLAFGDPPPSLEGVTWVKGAAPSFEAPLTMIELWATWCPPCVESIAHLTELAKKHEGKLEIAGLSGEDLDTVAPFVKQQKKGMAYNVGAAPEALYERVSLGVDGIPHAFLFDEAGLLWQGHPMAVDDLVERLLSGAADREQIVKIGALNAEYVGLSNAPVDTEAELEKNVARRLAITYELLDLRTGPDETLCRALFELGASMNERDYQKLLARIGREELAPAEAVRIADWFASMPLDRQSPSLQHRLLERALAPEDAPVYEVELAGDAYARFGDLERALAAFERALRLAQGDEALTKKIAAARQLIAERDRKGSARPARKPARPARQAAKAPPKRGTGARPASKRTTR